MKRNGTGMMLAGIVLILAAAGLTIYNLQESDKAEVSSTNVVNQLELHTAMEVSTEYVEIHPQPDYLRFPDMEMPMVAVEEQKYIGTLQIPRLGLELPVISEWSEEALKTAPCRYQGSAYSGRLIVMAHNYDSHFGRLHKLRPEDDVSFTDIEGNLFTYEVVDLEEIPGTDVESMLAGEWDLTLFTCTYGGQKRVTVRCVSVE